MANLLNSLMEENFLLAPDFDGWKIEKSDLQDEQIFDDNTCESLSSFFNTNLSESFLNSILNTAAPINAANECSSDSGLSCEQSFSPTRIDDIDDLASLNTALEAENPSPIGFQTIFENLAPEDNEIDTEEQEVDEFNAVEFLKEEVVEYEEMQLDSVSLSGSDSNSGKIFFVEDDDDIIIENPENDSDFMADSPVLLSYPDSKTIKLVSPNMKYRVKRMKNGSRLPLKNGPAKRKNSDDTVSEKDGSDESDFLYPRLQLTPEEQKLAVKEGIKLPSHYPLTKSQERELKRIRRKIRNKISAQDSRRRKKEYVDQLEEKVKRTAEENASLLKRIKTLENQKLNLAAQVRKLQASLARCSGQTAQPSTCLLVLIMSLALVLAPTLRNSTMGGETEDEGISLPEDSRPSLDGMRSHSRNLLFSHKAHEGQCNVEEETKTITEHLKAMQILDPKMISGLVEAMKLKIGREDAVIKDHDYLKPRKRSASSYNDSWPPLKMIKNSENIINSLILDNNNKSEPVDFDKPGVIDLMSD